MQRMTYFSAYLYKLSFPDSAECVKNSLQQNIGKNYFLLVFCVVVFFADDVVPVFVVFADCFLMQRFSFCQSAFLLLLSQQFSVWLPALSPLKQLFVQLFSLSLLMQLSVQLLSLPLLMQLPLLLF